MNTVSTYMYMNIHRRFIHNISKVVITQVCIYMLWYIHSIENYLGKYRNKVLAHAITRWISKCHTKWKN